MVQSVLILGQPPKQYKLNDSPIAFMEEDA